MPTDSKVTSSKLITLFLAYEESLTSESPSNARDDLIKGLIEADQFKQLKDADIDTLIYDSGLIWLGRGYSPFRDFAKQVEAKLNNL